MFEQSLALRRQLEDSQGSAGCLNNLGNVARARGRYEEARSLYRASIAVLREIGNESRIALVLNNLGEVAQYERDAETARALYEQSLAVNLAVKDRGGIAARLEGFAGLAAAAGGAERAMRLAGAANRLRATLGMPGQPQEEELFRNWLEPPTTHVVLDGIRPASLYVGGRRRAAHGSSATDWRSCARLHRLAVALTFA